MSDALSRIVARMRADDPEFGEEVDRQVARAELIAPIVEARRARGWSQRDLARASGVAQPVIARLEVGDTDPKISTLTRLAAALGLRIAFAPKRDAG
jgi:ribosome-binding protein aMBF1 (putative translation factor)